MAEIVSKGLEIICVEVRVIPEDMVVTGSRGALDPFVGHQVEVALCGMVDALVNDSASKSITILVLIVVSGEESASHKPSKKVQLK